MMLLADAPRPSTSAASPSPRATRAGPVASSSRTAATRRKSRRYFASPPRRCQFTDRRTRVRGSALRRYRRRQAAVAEVGEAIDVILDDQDHAPESILVCTTSSAMRDQLIDEYAFVRWEDRDERTIVCENIHRAKGLEFDHVVVVTATPSSPTT